MRHQEFRRVRVPYNPDAARVFGRDYEEIPIIVPERMVVFSPHPDDETLSCGGTISKYAALGSQVVVLLVKGAPPTRMREFSLALDTLGCDTRHSRSLELPIDDGLDDEIIGRLTNSIRELRPQWIFLPHPDDRHRTHRAVARAVLESVYHAGSKTYLDDPRYYSPHQVKGGLLRDKGSRPALHPWLPMGVFHYESPSFKFEYRSQDQAPMAVCDITGEPYETKFRVLDSVYRETLEDIDSYKRWAVSVADQRGALIYSSKGEAFGIDTHHVPVRMLPV
jgi:LmbE family N-acetylglucosaminyl deacetylase